MCGREAHALGLRARMKDGSEISAGGESPPRGAAFVAVSGKHVPQLLVPLAFLARVASDKS